jgi:hypothetical protein
MRIPIVLASLILVAACQPREEGVVTTVTGPEFKEALLSELVAADRVVVLEHSDPSDFLNDEGEGPDNPKRIVYRSVELDADAKARLKGNVKLMDASVPTLLAACAFVPRHTIQIYVGSTLSSELQICYECGDIQWSKIDAVEPSGLLSALTPIVLAAGLEQERDWRALAASDESGEQ